MHCKSVSDESMVISSLLFVNAAEVKENTFCYNCYLYH